MRRKAFTLIELIAVLVILAILALIVTPLVMNIIKKARISADKRSIDAYGRSIELAVATYLLDEGRFPTNVSDLTIEYTGDQVVCSTTQLNSDSSVYLAGCTVAGRNVEYTYGENKTPTYESYSVGDEVTYNNVDYYVIKDSSESEDSVTLLKAEPLTVEEVNLYGGVGTENNHVNQYKESPQGTAYNNNGYGHMAYYNTSTCRYVNNNFVETGCTSDYADSDVKYVVDAWKTAQAKEASEARLITKDEYLDMSTIEIDQTATAEKIKYIPMYDWLGVDSYWTMTPKDDSVSSVVIAGSSLFFYSAVGDTTSGVRPVIILSKAKI